MATANSTAFNNAVSVTPSEVKAALRLVGTEYPELCRSMEIAEKMIVHCSRQNLWIATPE